MFLSKKKFVDRSDFPNDFHALDFCVLRDPMFSLIQNCVQVDSSGDSSLLKIKQKSEDIGAIFCPKFFSGYSGS